MKKTTILLAASSCLLIFGFQFSSNITSGVYAPSSSGGAPAGNTGAPGEQNCTACHSGTAQSGDNQNLLKILDAGGNPVTAYMPGEVYDVQLTTNISGKKGFQSTALTSANAMAGSFTGNTGNTAVALFNGREYANHTSSSNGSGTSIWQWDWTAPAAGSGEVTFYVATNDANNNGANSGDVIYLSQHIISESPSSSLEELSTSIDVVSFIPEKNEVFLSLLMDNGSNLLFSLYDMNGNVVQSQMLGAVSTGLNDFHVNVSDDIKSGSYIVRLAGGSKNFTRQVQIIR